MHRTWEKASQKRLERLLLGVVIVRRSFDLLKVVRLLSSFLLLLLLQLLLLLRMFVWLRSTGSDVLLSSGEQESVLVEDGSAVLP